MLRLIPGFQVGRPQVMAGLMLLAFLAQCFWVASSRKMSQLELQYVESGFPPKAGQEYRVISPLTGWVGAIPFRIARLSAGNQMSQAPFVPGPLLARLPFIAFGLWLGAALWWVARRLFDDAGGYVALALYCSSPAMVMIASNIGPEILLAWSIFGLMYTAIGVAHTLYAPPRKWFPRIVILGLAIGFSFSIALWSFTVVLLALAFMLYLAPGRRGAAVRVILGSSAIGIGMYVFFVGLTGAHWVATHSLITPHLSLEPVRNLKFVFADGYTNPDSFLFVAFF